MVHQEDHMTEHVGMLAPQRASAPAKAKCALDVAGVSMEAPPGVDLMDGWAWDSVRQVQVPANWPAETVERYRADEQQNRETAEAEERRVAQQDTTRAHRLWIEAGAPVTPSAEDQLTALESRLSSVEAALIEAKVRIAQLEAAADAAKPAPVGRIPRSPRGSGSAA
jgi:hypothetical protein